MEKYTIPEITNESEWLYLTGQPETPSSATNGSSMSSTEPTGSSSSSRQHPFAPIKPKQILLVDIFSSWSGPCAAMESHLRRMRLQFVEAPDSLALAKACCDDIQELQPFKSDPRPTFLFWARGKAVALLRGANRPLLTQLIEQEVETEVREAPREDVDIDFASHRVIQCQGRLAQLDEDEVVHSIGSGSTEMLTSFFQDPPITGGGKKRSHLPPEEQQQPQQQEDVVVAKVEEQQPQEVVAVEAPVVVDQVSEEDSDVEEEDDSATVATSAAGFGTRKKSKKTKKLETGLLKEIMDAKHSKIFGGIM